MTVQANLPPTNTNSDGVTKTFNYNFKVTREEHLKATYTVIATGETGDLEIDSVTGIGNDGGGTVTFAEAPADGMIVTVNSIAPLSQIESFTGNKLPPATVERAIDAQAIINQRQQSEINRTVRFPASDEEIPTLPARAQRADKILGFTADGSDFLMVEGAAASQAYVDATKVQADRAVAAVTYPYTSGETKSGAFMPSAGEHLTLFTYNSVSDAAVTLPALSGLATSYNIGICRTAGSGDLTISAADGALINGQSSIVLASDYLCLDLTINEAGDEWVAVDKAVIGIPIGVGAGNIVALDSAGKLPVVDGSQLQSVKDNTARDVAITSYIKADIQSDDPLGTYGSLNSDNFTSDSLAQSTGASYDSSNGWYTNETTDTMVPAASGTPIGNLTDGGGLAAAFNGVTVQTSGTCARLPTSEGYVGKDWGNGVTRHIAKFDLYPSSDVGFTTASGSDIEIRLYGSNSEPSNATDGTQLYSSGVVANQTSVFSVTSGITSDTAYRYHWIAIIDVTSGSQYVAEVQFFELSVASNMTLRPEPITLETADPTDSIVYFRVEDIDSVDEETDRIIKVSIDGGSTWETCDITVIGAWGVDDTLIKAEGDVSGQTGSSFLWELTTANNKQQRIKQVVSVPSY